MESEPAIKSIEEVEAIVDSALEGDDDPDYWTEQERRVMELWNLACRDTGEVGEAAVQGLGRVAREHANRGIQSQASDRLDRLAKESTDPEQQRRAAAELREILKNG